MNKACRQASSTTDTDQVMFPVVFFSFSVGLNVCFNVLFCVKPLCMALRKTTVEICNKMCDHIPQ